MVTVFGGSIQTGDVCQVGCHSSLSTIVFRHPASFQQNDETFLIRMNRQKHLGY